MLETLKDAFVTAFKKPVTWVAIIGIPIIVGVFALLYVNTFIDPFERMKNVPIAVISEDAGAYVDGEYKNYGDELVDSICENDSAKWTVEDRRSLTTAWRTPTTWSPSSSRAISRRR